MSNRQTYPASQSPLQGDISGAAGATKVTVTGLQTVPILSTPPTDQQLLTFIAADGLWEPVSLGNASMLFEGHSISDDYDVFCNGVDFTCLVDWPYDFTSQIFVEGSAVS